MQHLLFWAEYEGKSSWKVGFIDNKKGCDANLTLLTLEMLWPSMKPYPKLEYGPDRAHGHATVHLGRTSGNYIKPLLGYLLSDNKSTRRNLNGFDKVQKFHRLLNTRLH